MKVVIETSFNDNFIARLTTLFRETTRYSIQQSGVWIPTLIRYFMNNESFCFLTVRDGFELISCLCLQKKDKRFYKFFSYSIFYDLGNGVNDFFNIPCKGGREEEAATHYAKWFRENSPCWEQLRLQFLPETKMHAAFVEAMQKYFPVQVSRDRLFYKINTNQSWDSYFTPEMNKRLRDVRGRKNRIDKSGHVVDSKVIDTGIEVFLDDFLVHFSKRRAEKGEKNSYEDEAKVKLIREVIDAAKQDQSVQLSILEDKHGAVWAYQLDLMDRKSGVWYHYAPTFNDAYREFSPSKVLLFDSLKRAFADPEIIEFNFMRGEAAYKKQFTDESEPYMEIQVTNSFSKKIKFQKLMAKIVGAS
ncbi:MAG: GNAT family N-acetyltransferase [Cyclobacteriaceae bacterium]|nr:GNAT family N-acetyltransferase [Cyclobacteriaceae bacterium]